MDNGPPYQNHEQRQERDSNAYVNCQAPDIIMRQPVASQPSNKLPAEEPVVATKPGNDVKQPNEKTSGSDDKFYSLDAEQTNRDWASELFFSIRGNPHNRTFVDNAKRAMRDCCYVPCMMWSIATRLGDPGYLPFVPCTGPAVRFKVRILGGITGTIGNDCVVTSCCWPCAVCQMYREMEDIGI